MYLRSLILAISLQIIQLSVAPSPCRADDLESARAKFTAGVELFASEDYAGALEAFEESYKMTPRSSTLFNMAMCQKALGMNEQAFDTFELFLKDTDLEPGAQMRVDAEAAIEELKAVVRRKDEQRPEAARMEPAEQPGSIEPPPGAAPELDEDHRATQSLANQASDKKDGGVSALFVTGIAASGLGLAATGVGVYFTSKYYEDWRKGEDAADECNESYSETCAETYADIDENKLPADTMGQVISYVAGGVLIATGVTLILIDWKRRRGGEEKEVAVVPAPGGVVIRF